jgi:hypothetical protein
MVRHKFRKEIIKKGGTKKEEYEGRRKEGRNDINKGTNEGTKDIMEETKEGGYEGRNKRSKKEGMLRISQMSRNEQRKEGRLSRIYIYIYIYYIYRYKCIYTCVYP